METLKEANENLVHVNNAQKQAEEKLKKAKDLLEHVKKTSIFSISYKNKSDIEYAKYKKHYWINEIKQIKKERREIKQFIKQIFSEKHKITEINKKYLKQVLANKQIVSFLKKNNCLKNFKYYTLRSTIDHNIWKFDIINFSANSFVWDDSDEGADFWEKIDDKWYDSIKLICKLKRKRNPKGLGKGMRVQVPYLPLIRTNVGD